MLAHQVLIRIAVAAAAALALSPSAATAAVRVVAPSSLPAGKAGIARVDAGPGMTVCALTARGGKVQQGPFRSAAKPVATFNWQVPANARAGRWTLTVRCAKTSKRLAKAKPRTAKVTVTATNPGGVRRLIASGSVRTVSSRVADFEPPPGGSECAAAWNGHRSTVDATGYCTGYDTWYVSKLLGHPATFGLGFTASTWAAIAPSRGLTVGTTAAPRTIAWWRGTRSEPSRVAVVQNVAGTAGAVSITVTEMNRKRWNVVTTRTFRLGAKGAPDKFISLPPVNIDNGGVSVPVPPVPLPTVLGAPALGAGRTTEVIAALRSGPGVLNTSYVGLGYGADNVFKAFHAGGLQSVPDPGRPLMAGDVTGDGLADLVTVPVGVGGSAPHYVVARSLGSGSFATPSATAGPLPELPYAAVTLDANLDGLADVFTIESGPTSVVALANGDGTFKRSAAVAMPQLTSELVAGDFDGDGKTDVFLGNNVWRSNGDGTFTRLPFAGQTATSTTAAGDVDGDGDADVFGIQFDALTNAWTYAVSRSNGDGTFTTQTVGPAAPIGPHDGDQVAAGDVNGDGHVDFVVSERADFGRAAYAVYLGAGDGSLTRTVLATGQAPVRLAVADFDGR